MMWLLAAFGLAALAAGGFFLWRRRLSPAARGPAGQGSGGMDVAMVQRLTDRFPAILRSAPEPALKADRRANALQGNLAQTPLHDLLQYLALGHKSGILELVSGRRTGRIVLKDGRVYKNSYRGKDGMDAMFMMMDLAEGDFEFYEQSLEDSVSFSGLEVVDIIMLWMDRKPKKKA
ncbi:MAG: hypothetical protein JWO30_2265 [Fibrobacteres bacterium]|nr:hypothetical protein [Fibrobacterota bacterium]